MQTYIKLLLCVSFFSLSGCQPETTQQINQQQNFMCKFLISGFLKAVRLPLYRIQLERVQHLHTQLHYIAHPEHYQSLMPQQQQLQLHCTQKAGFIFLDLIDPQTHHPERVLSLKTPEAPLVKRLTAYHLSNKGPE